MSYLACRGDSCASFTISTRLLVNTTNTDDCVAVKVQCPSPDQQLANGISIYKCYQGQWFPFTPLPCLSDHADNIVNKGVILGCTLGALVCVAIIIFSIIMFRKIRKEAQEDEERDRVIQDKMNYVREYADSVSISYRSTHYTMDDENNDITQIT